MNPKPLLALNHFTVPCSFNCVSLFCLSYLVLSHRLQHKKRAASVDLQPLHESKGFTRATNALSFSHDCPLLSTRILDRDLLTWARSMSCKGLTVAAINGLYAFKCRFGDGRRRKTACSLADWQIVNYNVAGSSHGGVAERLKAAVLKTVRPERVSWVRIPPPPPF